MITNDSFRPSITIDQMIQREVLCCMSSLVSTLNEGFESVASMSKSCALLCEQAFELAAPVLDYEEAATQAGWKSSDYTTTKNTLGYFVTRDVDEVDNVNDDGPPQFDTWLEACNFDGLDPYEWEVYEHWAVSQWLAEKLIAQGERVDTDFADLNIWARTTTGQVISMDDCIQRIYAEMMKPHVLDSVAPGA